MDFDGTLHREFKFKVQKQVTIPWVIVSSGVFRHTREVAYEEIIGERLEFPCEKIYHPDFGKDLRAMGR